MHILLVEPYHGGSHAAWADGYAARSSHRVTTVTHPARFWKWRMHGSALTLAEEVAGAIEQHGKPDVVLVSSMTDVAAFAGMIRGLAPDAPVAAYFHESQFTYPLSPLDRADLTYAMKNWMSAAAADLVIFNSAFHRSVFFDGAMSLLRSLPDARHDHAVGAVRSRSIVLPVGVDSAVLVERSVVREGDPLIVWNHRWEHDKGPDDLLAVVEALIARAIAVRVAMCGEVFVSVPPEFTVVTERLGPLLVHAGWLPRDEYLSLLSSSSVVLSTAHQEFFGIGVVEAIACGARPVLPRRLVYPERVAELGLSPDAMLWDDPAGAADRIVAALGLPPDRHAREATLRYDWSVVAARYDEALATLVAGGPFRA